MSDDYIAFCEEKLWCAWKQHTLSMPLRFDCDAAPEPYLYFGTGSNRLVALTTNPGGTMRHQRRDAVRARMGPLRDEDSYAEAARRLGCFYEKILEGRPAGHRIAKLRKLSSLLRHDGVMQVELIPFHSAALPRKNALLGQINEKDSLLGRYVELLREFLKNRPVVSIQAVSTRASTRNSCFHKKLEASALFEGLPSLHNFGTIGKFCGLRTSPGGPVCNLTTRHSRQPNF